MRTCRGSNLWLRYRLHPAGRDHKEQDPHASRCHIPQPAEVRCHRFVFDLDGGFRARATNARSVRICLRRQRPGLRAVNSTVDTHLGVAWCRRSASSLASFEHCWRGAWYPRLRWLRCRRNSWRLTAGSNVASSCCPSARTTAGPTKASEASACTTVPSTHHRCADDRLRVASLRMRIAAV